MCNLMGKQVHILVRGMGKASMKTRGQVSIFTVVPRFKALTLVLFHMISMERLRLLMGCHLMAHLLKTSASSVLVSLAIYLIKVARPNNLMGKMQPHLSRRTHMLLVVRCHQLILHLALHQRGIISSRSLVQDLHRCTHSNMVLVMLKWGVTVLTLPRNKATVINQLRTIRVMVATLGVQIQQFMVVQLMGPHRLANPVSLNQCQLSLGMISQLHILLVMVLCLLVMGRVFRRSLAMVSLVMMPLRCMVLHLVNFSFNVTKFVLDIDDLFLLLLLLIMFIS